MSWAVTRVIVVGIFGLAVMACLGITIRASDRIKFDCWPRTRRHDSEWLAAESLQPVHSPAIGKVLRNGNIFANYLSSRRPNFSKVPKEILEKSHELRPAGNWRRT